MHTRLHNTYIGVGSSAPDNIIDRVQRVSTGLAKHHYKLRSDGESGISSIFEKNSHDSEIYLPYKNYNNHQSPLHKSSKEAEYIANKYHPAFDALNTEQRKIITRYSHLVLGKDLREPALFALVYSEDGAESAKEVTSRTGVVGHVIILCQSLSIPIHNLVRDNVLIRIEKLLGIELG